MRRTASIIAVLALTVPPALLGGGSRALAGMPVELVLHPASRGAEIVLGDLFDGVEGPAAMVVVGRGAAPGQSAVLDAGRVQLAAHQAGLDWDNTRGLRRVVVEGGEAEVAAPVQPAVRPHSSSRGAAGRGRNLQAEAPRTVQVLVYARNIPAGEILAADDLTWAETLAATRLADPVGDPDAVVGKVARRPLRAGSPALARDLAGAKVIHRDELVAVQFRDDGMVLSLHGRALGDAAVGEPVQILNLASKKTVEAVAAGPGRALVGPEADAIRTAPARSPLSTSYSSTYASVR
jgi:flagellar basal body P-ring formation protein FlgA